VIVRARDPVFVFSGHGSQWWGMERELLEHEPAFAAELRACDVILRDLVGWSLLERMADPATRRLFAAGGEVTQPAIVSMQVSLAALWRSWGVEPRAVVGHSVGEISAARVAGALSLEDALRIVVLRNELLRESQWLGGAMAVVAADSQEVERQIASRRGRVFVAGVNAPGSTLLAGLRGDLLAVVEAIRAHGGKAQMVRADGLAHCPLVERLGEHLVERIGVLETRAAEVAFYSSVTGGPLPASAACEPGYWGRNLTAPVAFAAAIHAMAGEGHELFLEVSPHPVIASSVSDCLRALGRAGNVLPSMHRERATRAHLGLTLAALREVGEARGLVAFGPGCAPTT
jgi:acyl transferase domain-containing protein